jgi:hypothetical protein
MLEDEWCGLSHVLVVVPWQLLSHEVSLSDGKARGSDNRCGKCVLVRVCEGLDTSASCSRWSVLWCSNNVSDRYTVSILRSESVFSSKMLVCTYKFATGDAPRADIYTLAVRTSCYQCTVFGRSLFAPLARRSADLWLCCGWIQVCTVLK